MDPVLLARIQFGMTVAFHFLFPPASIGLAWLIAFMGWRYVRTGEDIWNQMMQFWVRILAIIFAIGVATGITMEFQFGTNWSTYSRFVGDIFGSPLAAEGVFAFFLESAFIGVLIWGRRRVSRKVYAFSALMVALGTTLSAFWIIVANSWQQTPVAYQIVGEGVMRRAELTNFWAAVFNPSTLPRYLHTLTASLFTGSFFVTGIGAWYLLKQRHLDFAKRTFTVGLITAAFASLAILGVGHAHAVQVAETQPAKLAAFEGLFETTAGAPLTLFGIPDADNQVLRAAIRLPKMLSFLVSFDTTTTITGLNQIPREEWPPIGISFYTYHLMFLLGFFFIGITWLGIILGKRRYSLRPLLWAFVIAIPLPWLAVEVGWGAAEMGRQPWVVYGLLKTADAVSVVVPAGQVLFTIILFALVYALLLGLFVYLVLREVRRGPVTVPVAPPKGHKGRKEGKR